MIFIRVCILFIVILYSASLLSDSNYVSSTLPINAKMSKIKELKSQIIEAVNNSYWLSFSFFSEDFVRLGSNINAKRRLLLLAPFVYAFDGMCRYYELNDTTIAAIKDEIIKCTPEEIEIRYRILLRNFLIKLLPSIQQQSIDFADLPFAEKGILLVKTIEDKKFGKDYSKIDTPRRKKTFLQHRLQEVGTIAFVHLCAENKIVLPNEIWSELVLQLVGMEVGLERINVRSESGEPDLMLYDLRRDILHLLRYQETWSKEIWDKVFVMMRHWTNVTNVLSSTLSNRDIPKRIIDKILSPDQSRASVAGRIVFIHAMQRDPQRLNAYRERLLSDNNADVLDAYQYVVGEGRYEIKYSQSVTEESPLRLLSRKCTPYKIAKQADRMRAAIEGKRGS